MEKNEQIILNEVKEIISLYNNWRSKIINNLNEFHCSNIKNINCWLKLEKAIYDEKKINIITHIKYLKKIFLKK